MLHLGERAKNILQFIGGNSYAAVPDHDTQFGPVRFRGGVLLFAGYFQRDFTLLGKFYGITEQIGDDLLQALLITADVCGETLGKCGGEGNSLLPGGGGIYPRQLAGHGGDGEYFRHEFQLACFYF